jgi:hypothetical protein
MTVIRPEVTGRRTASSSSVPTAINHSRDLPLERPDWIELEKHVSVPEAARIKGISPDTFKRHYPHLIRRPSPRRCTVKLRDLLADDAA